MRRLIRGSASFVALLYIFLMGIAGYAASPICSPQRIAISGIDQTATLNGTFRTVQIWSDSGSADVYVELNGNVATVGGATTLRIAGGGTYQTPTGNNVNISSFHFIGASGTGTLNVAAF